MNEEELERVFLVYMCEGVDQLELLFILLLDYYQKTEGVIII